MNKITRIASRFPIALFLIFMLFQNEGFGKPFTGPGCPVFSETNPVPTISSAGITTFCEGGSVMLNSSVALTYQWYKNGIAILDETDPSYNVHESGTYTVVVTYDGVTPVSSAGIQIKQTNTWTGAAGTTDWFTAANWSCGVVPTNQDYAIVPQTLHQPVVSEGGNVTAYSLLLQNNAVLTASPGTNLVIENEVVVVPSASLVIESNASLVQINAASNIGSVTVKRNTTPVKRFDFTYWSSPVSGQTLYNLSPTTQYDKYMSFNPTIGNWVTHVNGAETMAIGKGYIVRAPQSFSTTIATPYTGGQFVGTPNNGQITTPVTIGNSEWNLIGNPYPSALDADVFISNPDNASVIDGTIYLWTHNSAPSTDVANPTYTYTSNDYASYNLLGGVGTSTSGNNDIPTGKIASGQAFFVKAIAPGVVKFNNGMRVTGNNEQFFRASQTAATPPPANEKHRIWLDLKNDMGVFKQTLVGYITGATDGIDRNYDGLAFNGNSFVDFYSIAAGENLTIQGRGLPFDENSSILLGYSTTIAGDFTISASNMDGLFTGHDVYLKDNLTGILHNLKGADYAFATESGTFNNRFELRYIDAALGIDNPDMANVTVFTNENQIGIQSGKAIRAVEIYDLLGRHIYSADVQDLTVFRTTTLTPHHQALIVKIVLADGTIITRKVIG